MTIDWITVSAQILNFIVLIVLLRRFLYQPVLDAMQSRQDLVERRLHEAGEREKKARQQERLWLSRQQEQTDCAAELLENAQTDAEAEREALIQAARQEAQEHSQQWLAELRHEQSELLNRLRTDLASAALQSAGRALQDLADETLERRMVTVLANKLASDDGSILPKLANSNETLIITTARALDEKSTDELSRSLRGLLPDTQQLKFEVNPEIVCGVQIASTAGTLGWNLQDYFLDLEERTSALLDTFPTHVTGV